MYANYIMKQEPDLRDCSISLYIRTYIQGWSGEQDVCGLGYVSGMQAVMVGHI